MKLINKIQSELDGFYKSNKNCHNILGYPINLDLEFMQPLSRFFVFPLNNIGNPLGDSVFQLCTWEYERQVLDFVAKLYKFPADESYHGYIGSGGTEANMQGLWIARESYPDGILYFSADSHYSVEKIARMLRMEYRIIPSQANGEIKYDDLAQAIIQHPDQPVILNLNIGTTMKGATDSIEIIMDILEQAGVSQHYIHCDAALFGMMLPFIDQAIYPNFSYNVQSIAISGHKFLGCPFPCGISLARTLPTAQHIQYVDVIDSTISGSRNGHAPLALWYALQIKGMTGLKKEVDFCLDNARYLYQQLKQHGYPCLLNPNSNIVFLKQPSPVIIQKWDLAVENDWAHVVTMQHVTRQGLDDFLQDLLGGF